jgi:dienelactone hydrolase
MKQCSRLKTFFLIVGAAIATVTLVTAQSFAPPPSKPPSEEVRQEIGAKMLKLSKAIQSLRMQNIRDPWLAELEIYHKAAAWILEHNEFYQPKAADWTLEALDRGLVRARQTAGGETSWVNTTGFPIIRAYRSRIDGSIQPYAVTFPADYGKEKKKWRLDVVLHGRDTGLTEVKFLHAFNGERAAPKEQSFVRIDIFGRGNNAYRWAGETDIFEALDHFLAVERMLGRDVLLDPAKVVLRGFSMGGAGTWHIGLHHPDRWAVLGPGAGFTTTKGYVKKLGELTPEQEACLHIYDAVDYAENAFNVPVVAYGGAKDPQLQAARNIEAELKKMRIPIELLVAPGLEHQFPPEWQAKAEQAYERHLGREREEMPTRVRFVTYTLRYPSCSWVEILGLDHHYARASVDAERTENGFTVKTANVRSLHLTLPTGKERVTIDIDSQSVQARAWQSRNVALNVYLERRNGRWASVRPQKLLVERGRRLQKTSGVQGPIDDAFMDGFICVRGTGERPWHEATLKYADASLDRFAKEWSKYLRGRLPVKNDVDITDQDIAGKHLILFGDPASNTLIADVLDGLPLKWTRASISLAGKTYDSGEHVPVLIYPNPLNPQRYVVLNSGHTFRAADFQGTNALLYPRLGDYAILKLTPTEKDPLGTTTAVAGLFDDFWQMGKK